MDKLLGINFYITDDNSVGMYDVELKEIFHSKTGALKESYQKFVEPIINSKFVFDESINVLDICYGIGYNTKTFLNKFCNRKINIDALEYNLDYINISPYINDGINDDDLKLFLTSSVYSQNYLEKFYSDNRLFCSQFTANLMHFISNSGYKYNPSFIKLSDLHNIYYKYISSSMKFDIKPNKYNNCSIRYHIGDSRQTIQTLNLEYDVVFLDGFSPKKSPVLWTIDFLNQIKQHMKQNSILVSYSHSTPFRSALIDLGFFVGKTIIDDKDMGTVASFNSSYIKNPLSGDDYKIISSRSGITYKDSNLNLSIHDITQNREIEIKTSNRISRSKIDKILNLNY